MDGALYIQRNAASDKSDRGGMPRALSRIHTKLTFLSDRCNYNNAVELRVTIYVGRKGAESAFNEDKLFSFSFRASFVCLPLADDSLNNERKRALFF